MAAKKVELVKGYTITTMPYTKIPLHVCDTCGTALTADRKGLRAHRKDHAPRDASNKKSQPRRGSAAVPPKPEDNSATADNENDAQQALRQLMAQSATPVDAQVIDCKLMVIDGELRVIMPVATLQQLLDSAK